MWIFICNFAKNNKVMIKNIGKKFRNCKGVYKITCNGNNQLYIGSSVDIQKRWQQHISHLRKGVHSSVYLQNSYNKYGEDSLNFEVICILNDSNEIELRNTEWYFIDLYKPQFNSAAPIIYNRTEEWKKRISESTKKLYSENGYINPRKNKGRKYKVLSSNGDIVYNNLSLAEIAHKVGSSDYHSFNNSIRKNGFAIIRKLYYMILPISTQPSEILNLILEYNKNNTNNIKLVNLSGDILTIHSYYYKKIRESIECSKNPLVQFKNELITYAFLPLYIEIYTEKHLNILGS